MTGLAYVAAPGALACSYLNAGGSFFATGLRTPRRIIEINPL
jgi:hypothetical protein